MNIMDTKDKWYHKYFPEYYKIYKAEAEVKNIIFSRIDKILKNIVSGTDVISLGHLTRKSRVKVRGNKDMAGVVSYENGDGAIYYKADTQTLWAYESPHQVHSIVEDTIRAIFGPLYDINIVGASSIVYPEDAVKFSRCRPGEESRLPYGFGCKLMINSLIKQDTEPTDVQRKQILSYACQYNFCYIEALIFLDQYIHKRPYHACICARSALVRIKLFVKTLDLNLKPAVYEQFMRIMNPVTGQVNYV